MRISIGCTEVTLVFDRYIKDSLKSRTRSKRTSGNEVKYHISHGTNISNIPLKQLLSHIETKKSLTIYLAQYAKAALNRQGFKYCVTYDQLSDTNMIDFTEELRSHDHEEADTLLLLHAIDVAQKDPFRECIMFSPDTDVFLLLLHYYESLPQITTFRTGRGNDKRDISIKNCVEAIGSDHAKAILGFHVFTGCDQTGRFNGKSKSSW